ncbi:MAG: insulinase family protein [Burkholderiales bacterium]|nr:insulinase family protein [Burkholderiales bacterium]
MFQHAFVALGLTLLAATTSVAQPRTAALPAGIQEVARVEGITEYRLANGLQLLLAPDDSKPSTTVNVTYRVGSRNESYGETGMAHLLEHLLFKGTPTTQNLWGEFTKRGLRANGSTWYDRTNYFATFAANDENLRWYLGWQADAMIHSFIARADLDTEMTVVRNEMESGENSPNRVLLQQTLATMYQWHNYGKSTIGARADVENVDIPRLQAFYRQYYQPDNATLIVSGRFDTARVLELVAKSFGPIPRPGRVIARNYTLDPAQDGERAVTLRRVGGAPLIYIGYHVPPGSSADFAAVTLLAQVLGDTPGGRLYKQVVERQLAANAFGFALALADPSPLFIGAALAPTQDVEKARAAILATVDSLASEPVTAQELERARTQWLNEWDKGFADPERIGVGISEAIAQGDWRLYFLARDQVRKVSLDDIRRVAAERLRRDNRTVGIYLPTAQPERAPAPARVDVAALVKDYRGDPGAVQAESFDPTPANLDARTQRFALASGLKVALLPKGTRGQAVQARLRLRFGDVASLNGQDTVAGFVGGLLDKGGAGMTRQQIADELDRLQADVGFFAHGQTVSVDITTRRERLPAVIALVGKLLREPNFAAPSLEELRVQWLTALERQKKEPDALIRNRLARYGNPYPRGDLRYEGTFEEDEQDVRAVTLAQVAAFHRRFYSAANGEFTAVGDLDPAAVRQAVTAAFADWKQPTGGALPYTRAPRPLVALAPARFMELTPDRANANLRGVLPLPLADTDADYPALLMANYLFGSGGSSRLWKRIRESGGLSYDVRSGIDWNPDEPNSTLSVSAIFAPQNQPRVEAALREELALSVKEGFTQKELDEARIGLLNLRRLSRAQDGNVASQLASDQRLGRSFAFVQQVDQAIEKLSLEQVNAAWRRYVDPARVVLAWGGDFKAAP